MDEIEKKNNFLLKKRVVVEKIKLRSKPFFESETLSKEFHFGDFVIGHKIIRLENDFDYLELKWQDQIGYLPLEYLVDADQSFDLAAKNLIFPLSFVPQNLILFPVQWTLNRSNVLVNKKTLDYFRKLKEAAEKDNIDLKVVGGYISIAEQSRIYMKEYEICFMQNVIEKPACSPYHLGTVIDITTSEINNRLHPLFYLTKTYNWLKKNSLRFNFMMTHSINSFLFQNKFWKPWQLQFIDTGKVREVQTYKKQNKSRYTFTSFKQSFLFYSAKHKSERIKYLFIHDNEHTARKSCRYAINRYGGTIFEIINGNKRNLQIPINNKLIEYDPNRIFTQKGLEENLRLINPECSDSIIKEALNQITDIRHAFLRALSLNRQDFLISVHTNNRLSELSIHYFLKDEVSDSFLVSICHDHHPKNFFYTISPEDYYYFKQKGYNVILQKESYQADDGSLSIWMSRKKMNYITLEVVEGSFSFQKRMLHHAVEYALRKPMMINKLIDR